MGIISGIRARRAVKKEAVRPYTELIKQSKNSKYVKEIKPKGERVKELQSELIDHQSMPLIASVGMVHFERKGKTITREARKIGEFILKNPNQTKYRIVSVNVKAPEGLTRKIGNFAIIDAEKGNKPVALIYKK